MNSCILAPNKSMSQKFTLTLYMIVGGNHEIVDMQIV